MNKKLLVTCGCSYTAGTNIPDTIPYGKILSENLKCDFINFARPGASNYFIAKQVEHSITLKPDFVCIGVTSPLRFDYIQDPFLINKKVSYEDFNKELYVTFPNKIESRSLFWFENQVKYKENNEFQKRECLEIYNFLSTKINSFIKEDQDKFTILGCCLLLERRKIPYVIVDFWNTFDSTDEFVIKLHAADLIKRYPSTVDKLHFNQIGQVFVFEKILNYIKLNFPTIF